MDRNYTSELTKTSKLSNNISNHRNDDQSEWIFCQMLQKKIDEHTQPVIEKMKSNWK